MGEAEGIAADRGEFRYRAGGGKEVVAQGFGDTEVADDAGAHPHRHRLQRRGGRHGDGAAALTQQPSGRLETELQVRNRLRHPVDHPCHFAVAPMQGAFDAGGARLEDHRMLWPGLRQLFQLLAEEAALHRVHGNRGLLEEDDRGPIRGGLMLRHLPQDRQSCHHGVAAVLSQSAATLLVELQILVAVEAQQIDAGTIEHALESEAEQDAGIGTHQQWAVVGVLPLRSEHEQGVAAASAVKPQHQHIDVSRHRTGELAEVFPAVFLNPGPRIRAADLQALTSGQGPVVDLQQVERRVRTLTPAGRQQGHRHLAERVEAGHSSDGAAGQALVGCSGHRPRSGTWQNYRGAA